MDQKINTEKEKVEYNRFAYKIQKDKTKNKNVFGETDVCWVDWCYHFKVVYRKYGTTIGALFDEIANQCRMNGVCTLSESDLGKEIGMSWHTVNRALKKMLEEKLIFLVDHNITDERVIDGNTKWYIISKERVYELQNEKIPILKSNKTRREFQEKGMDQIKKKKKEDFNDKNG
jgi:transcription initiation factor IIE alpha subunit